MFGLLGSPDNRYTENEEDTLKLLAETHFPNSVIVDGSHSREQEPLQRPSFLDWRQAAIIFRPNVVKWAICSFEPYKCPGEDKILPVLLQKGMDIILQDLLKIFRASFAWGYIPTIWSKVNVTYIPKAGTQTRSQPKSYRPISLTSFLLKTMEKVINRHIVDGVLKKQPLNNRQCAYVKGKSTETALAHLVNKAEKALEEKEIALCTFLDIAGAFDNTKKEIIMEAVKSKDIDKTTSKWIESMLSHRFINTSLNGYHLVIQAKRGCPQGGVLSPLLWSLVVDSLLTTLMKANIDVLGYADDIAIIVRGKSENTISELTQTALCIVERWCKRHKLSVNTSKTVIVPFTKRRKVTLKPPTFFGEILKFSTEVKYLGVTLDSGLNWNRHVDKVLQRATNALWICRRFSGKTWGMSPKISLWLYKAIVRPMVAYGAVAWWTKTTQITCRAKLSKLQRLACTSITGAMASTPTMAIEALLNLSPLHIFIAAEAKSSVYRLTLEKGPRWLCRSLRNTHNWVENHPITGMLSDHMSTAYDFHKPFKTNIYDRVSWSNGDIQSILGNEDMVWYTDGSKTDDGVGAGIYSERPQTNIYISLGKYASIFQAEVYAIAMCAYEIARQGYKNKTIYILSDSQAALKAINSPAINSKIVWECINSLKQLSSSNRTVIGWVPGHAGIDGNEKADELARLGASTPLNGPEPFIGIPKSTVKNIIKEWVNQESNHLWHDTNGQETSKFLIREFSWKKTTERLQLGKNQLRILTGLLTGHCRLNKHMRRIRASENDSCRFCHEEDETSIHILCECEALCHKRDFELGWSKLQPREIHERHPRDILRYINAIGLSECL